MYCIYTNTDIEASDSNEEHIIPLSLGGKNGFTIKVSKNINSDLGSKLDGALNKDFLINSIRRKKGYKGHSKTVPNFKVKATITGTNERVEIRYNGTENYLYNPRTKKRFTEEEKRQVELNTIHPFDKSIRIRFIAKVILGAGHFIYGNEFKECIDHESLRRIMNWNLLDVNNKVANIPVGLTDEFSDVPADNIKWNRIFKIMCNSLDCSSVIFIIGLNQIVGVVGIGGRYIGAINFKAEGDKLGYKEGPADGIVLAIQNNKIKKNSFHQVLKKIKMRIDSNDKEN